MTISPERVYQRVIHWADRADSGCLVSRYSVGSHGYAQVGWVEDGRKTVTLCHRVVWEHVHGPVPVGMTVDHVCHNARCVEESHLRLLSNFENARRTNGRDWPLGECANGHPNSELRRYGKSKIHCRPCANEANRRWRARKKQSL